MPPTRLDRLTSHRAAVTALLCLGAASACRDAVAPAPSEARVAKVELRPFDQAIVDSPYVAPAYVTDRDGGKLSGVAVHWVVPSPTGVDSMVSYTDTSGQAVISWRPPTTAGTYQLRATAGSSASAIENIDVRPGAPAGFFGLPDSIRFTRMDGYSRSSIRLLDKYGNRLTQLGSVLEFEVAGPFAAAFIGDDSISLGGSRLATGAGDVAVRVAARLDPTRPVLARVKLVMDPVVANVAIRGGVDSVSGLAVGEADTLSVSVTDSSGVTIPKADLAKLGVQFTSSNTSVATISPNGVITGVGAGTVTMSATYASTSYSVTLRVGEYSIYDFGAVRQLYGRPLDQLYYVVQPISIDAAGNSLLVTNGYGRPTGSSVTMGLKWFDPDGQVRLSRDYTVFGTSETGSAAFDSSGGVYVSYPGLTPFTALDASGAERWRVALGGTPVAFAGGVYVYRDAALHALSLDGTERWSHTFGASIARVLPSPSMLFVRTTSATGTSIFALSLAGDSLWARAGTSYTVITDGAGIYFTTTDGSIQAVDNAGNTVWSVAGSVNSQVVLGPNQSLIVAESKQLKALDRATGRTLWSVSTLIDGNRPIQVVGNKVYAFSTYLYVWDATTGASLGRSAQRWDMYAGRCTSAGAVFVTGLSVYRYDRC